MAADNRAPSHMRTGLFYAIITYLMWGMLPLYFNLMADASPVEIVASRVVFSLIFCAALLPMLKLTGGFVEVLRNRRATLVLFAASLLIGVNWFIYVLATTTGRTIDASLGYFINPLVSVSLGVIFLKERLRVAQWVAVGLSAVAVLIMSVVYGQVPFIGLGLAFSFGIYGLAARLHRWFRCLWRRCCSFLLPCWRWCGCRVRGSPQCSPRRSGFCCWPPRGW